MMDERKVQPAEGRASSSAASTSPSSASSSLFHLPPSVLLLSSLLSTSSHGHTHISDIDPADDPLEGMRRLEQAKHAAGSAGVPSRRRREGGGGGSQSSRSAANGHHHQPQQPRSSHLQNGFAASCPPSSSAALSSLGMWSLPLPPQRPLCPFRHASSSGCSPHAAPASNDDDDHLDHSVTSATIAALAQQMDEAKRRVEQRDAERASQLQASGAAWQAQLEAQAAAAEACKLQLVGELEALLTSAAQQRSEERRVDAEGAADRERKLAAEVEAELAQQDEQLRAEREAAQSRQQELQARLEAQTAEHSQLKQQLLTAVSSESLAAAISASEEKNSAHLSAQLKQLQQRHDSSLQQQRAEHEQTLDELKLALAATAGRVEELESKSAALEDRQAALEEAQGEVQRLKTEMYVLQGRIETLSDQLAAQARLISERRASPRFDAPRQSAEAAPSEPAARAATPAPAYSSKPIQQPSPRPEMKEEVQTTHSDPSHAAELALSSLASSAPAGGPTRNVSVLAHAAAFSSRMLTGAQPQQVAPEVIAEEHEGLEDSDPVPTHDTAAQEEGGAESMSQREFAASQQEYREAAQQSDEEEEKEQQIEESRATPFGGVHPPSSQAGEPEPTPADEEGAAEPPPPKPRSKRRSLAAGKGASAHSTSTAALKSAGVSKQLAAAPSKRKAATKRKSRAARLDDDEDYVVEREERSSSRRKPAARLSPKRTRVSQSNRDGGLETQKGEAESPQQLKEASVLHPPSSPPIDSPPSTASAPPAASPKPAGGVTSSDPIVISPEDSPPIAASAVPIVAAHRTRTQSLLDESKQQAASLPRPSQAAAKPVTAPVTPKKLVPSALLSQPEPIVASIKKVTPALSRRSTAVKPPVTPSSPAATDEYNLDRFLDETSSLQPARPVTPPKLARSRTTAATAPDSGGGGGRSKKKRSSSPLSQTQFRPRSQTPPSHAERMKKQKQQQQQSAQSQRPPSPPKARRGNFFGFSPEVEDESMDQSRIDNGIQVEKVTRSPLPQQQREEQEEEDGAGSPFLPLTAPFVSRGRSSRLVASQAASFDFQRPSSRVSVGSKRIYATPQRASWHSMSQPMEGGDDPFEE